jgi:5-methyltetrahydropteroyltriglutamate--homocysteine methyltransferase
MTTSPSRILTSHVGSLPRSETLVTLLEQRENGVPYDVAAFDRTVARFVAALVKRQVDIGLDIVSDGEASKISYATYVRDRLTGFTDASQGEASKPTSI